MNGRQYQPPPSSSSQRDAAFSNIFGAAPPPGRSQTMTSAAPQVPQDRAQTMSGATAQYMQRAPPMRPGAMPPQMNGQPYPPRSADGPPQGAVNPPYAAPAGGSPQRRPIPPPGQQQGLPQPIRADRVPYGGPQRMDPRGVPVPPGGGYQRSFTARGPMPPGAATRDDPYRTQSLASQPRPPMQQNQYGTDPSRSFRQQPPYQGGHVARTTAQGRVVPDRPSDERTMSMSSYSRSEHEGGGTTTMSGRVIPGRTGQFRDGGSPDGGPGPGQRPQVQHGASASDYQRAQTITNGYHPEMQRVPNGAHPQQHYGANGRNPSNGSSNSRTMSMASTVVSPAETPGTRPNLSTQTSGGSTTRQNSQLSHTPSTMIAQKKPSLVYGALLSNVAAAFRDRVALSEREKDGLVYQNAFTGFAAVDLISFIIRTSDRNLALLLGRSLDAQKFFHEVAYAHRLRDSPNEIYQFKETLGTGSQEALEGMSPSGEVNGVFTLLTECYSPTCNRDNLCYSIACPRRLEQQQRLNLKQSPGLRKEASTESLHGDDDDDTSGAEQKLWINTVSADVAASTSEREKKRQEVISELAYTERDFVKDLEYLRDFWIKPLRNPDTSPIPEHRREKFVRCVFGNVQEIHAVNARFASAMTRRQQVHPVVDRVGDVMLEAMHGGGMIPANAMGAPPGGEGFAGFIKYGANQLYGKTEFERERQNNPAFAKFVEQTERLKESRKLELNGYLTKPTTRLARYPLLLENVLKSTERESSAPDAKNGMHPDQTDIPKAIITIRGVLARVNEESGKSENHFNMVNLNAALKWGAIQYMDLKLTEETRQLIFKSMLKKTPTSESADITAYLFDHAVLLVRVKGIGKGREEQRVYRKPIPLELLQIKEMDAVLPRLGINKRPSSSMVPSLTMGSRTATMTTMKSGVEQGWPITFKGLGKGGYEITLYCTTQIQREKWMEHIATQKDKLAERHNVFTMAKLSEGFFSGAIRVNCCRPVDGGRKLVIGTDMGVYVTERKPRDASLKPKRVLDLKPVSQLEVLEQHGVVIVLADKVVYSYPLEAVLDYGDDGSSSSTSASAAAKRGRRICSASYVNAGMCNGQTLVCCVRSTSLSSTVKVYEPMDSMTKGKKKSGLARMMGAGQEVLKPYKEFYIPMESNSIHFLRSKLCVGGAKGFEIVSLETLETQSLLDQADTSLDFVTRAAHHNSTSHPLRPIYIERNTSEFLLCYNDFSFYVNKNGWRARGDWKILWEGSPNAFATWGEKYILAFEPEFIEVRSSETGGLICIECHKGIRFLHQSTREILFAYEDELGDDVIASLDFWGRPQSPQTHGR
ncbi:CNH-domain-containing protein [Polychaeton citri CBS 116435]|uniref:CNH-domain-containing protein n=1 Tax=Polychaeton citri CBS 116435 TaxID=1314669 RepID=A0A9P4Q0C9_9PEZI|nr:CNH-domain-containing protein [Polychaeton citri CBS 116435]